MPAKDEMPATLKRSPAKAQRTWAKSHDSAVETYGEGERAHRTAFAALKHSFEKVGDRWQPKKSKGPSDPQAAKGGRGREEGRQDLRRRRRGRQQPQDAVRAGQGPGREGPLQDVQGAAGEAIARKQ